MANTTNKLLILPILNKHFHDDVKSWYACISANFYKDDIKGLFHRCKKCIARDQYVVNGFIFRSLAHTDKDEDRNLTSLPL